MKNHLPLLLILGAILLNTFANKVNAQTWEIIKKGNKNYYQVFSISDETIHVLSEENYLLSSYDSGITWDSVFFKSNLDYVQFLTKDTGFIASKEYIYKTYNGGVLWDSLPLPPDVVPNPIFWLNSNSVFTRSDGLHTMVSHDRGITWTKHQHCEGFMPQGIFFWNEREGIIAGWYIGTICRTFDGGKTWKNVFQGGSIFSIAFPLTEIGFTVGRGIYKSVDQGISWVEKTNGISQNHLNSLFFNDIYCLNENTCYTVSEGFGGIIYKTLNGGETWELDSTQIQKSLFSIHCGRNVCFAVGDGVILRKTGVGVSVKEDVPEKQNFKVYPNPAKEIINISLPENLKVQSIKLHDMQGRLIKSFSPEERTLNMGNIAHGKYMLTIEVENGVFTEKVVLW